MIRRRFRKWFPLRGKVPGLGIFLSLNPCQSGNPEALQTFVCAGRATETQPPPGTELWDFVGLWVQNTFIEGILWGLGPFLPPHPRAGSFPHSALQPQIPQLRYSLPSLKSIIRAINPAGLSSFVCWLFCCCCFLFFNSGFSPLFLPSSFFLLAWQWHLGFLWLFFLYLYSPLT